MRSLEGVMSGELTLIIAAVVLHGVPLNYETYVHPRALVSVTRTLGGSSNLRRRCKNAVREIDTGPDHFFGLEGGTPACEDLRHLKLIWLSKAAYP